MPAKPLNTEQLADAQRLTDAWLRYKAAHPAASQEQVAHACGWKTQGAFNQYLKGKIPLNLRALSKIATAIDADIAEISPSLAAELNAAHAGSKASSMSTKIARAAQEHVLSDEVANAILTLITASPKKDAD